MVLEVGGRGDQATRWAMKWTCGKSASRDPIVIYLIILELSPMNLRTEGYNAGEVLLTSMELNVSQPTPIRDQPSSVSKMSTEGPHPKKHVRQSFVDKFTPPPPHPSPVYPPLRFTQQGMSEFQLNY